MRDINFVCPLCGCDRLNYKELLYEYHEVFGLDDDGNLNLNLHETIRECGSYVGDGTGFVCADCEGIIAGGEKDLIPWLERRGMVGEEI